MINVPRCCGPRQSFCRGNWSFMLRSLEWVLLWVPVTVLLLVLLTALLQVLLWVPVTALLLGLQWVLLWVLLTALLQVLMW